MSSIYGVGTEGCESTGSSAGCVDELGGAADAGDAD